MHFEYRPELFKKCASQQAKKPKVNNKEKSIKNRNKKAFQAQTKGKSDCRSHYNKKTGIYKVQKNDNWDKISRCLEIDPKTEIRHNGEVIKNRDVIGAGWEIEIIRQ
jgi:hypothetical protein